MRSFLFLFCILRAGFSFASGMEQKLPYIICILADDMNPEVGLVKEEIKNNSRSVNLGQ